MRIKKFTCINCGAPKVNEYNSPYIVCDYCGSFTDIDFALGMNFWNQSPLTTIGYQFNKILYAQQLQRAMLSSDKAEYNRLQREYWDFYYRTYPAYLPPSINTGEKYKLYLDVCADSSTEYAFDKSVSESVSKLNQMQQSLSYYQTAEGVKVHSDTFFQMAEFYIGMTKDSFRDFYGKEEYAIMNELLPQEVHLKMKMSMFVQVWIPYLTDADIDRFLKLTGFSMQYMEIEKPAGRNTECKNCKANVYVPEGSYKVYCESCHRVMQVEMTFKCSSCGAQNNVPDTPSRPVDCEFCGVENRLIQRFFG